MEENIAKSKTKYPFSSIRKYYRSYKKINYSQPKKNAKKGILDPRRHEDDNRDAADMDLSEYMMENMDDGDEEFEPLDPHTAKEIIKGRNIEEENDFYGAYK